HSAVVMCFARFVKSKLFPAHGRNGGQCTSSCFNSTLELAAGKLCRPGAGGIQGLVCQLSIGGVLGWKGGRSNSKYSASPFTIGSYKWRSSARHVSTAAASRSVRPAPLNDARSAERAAADKRS